MTIWIASLFTMTALAGDVAPGEKAPNFSLPDLDGKVLELESLRGQTVVLEWFNPGCPFVVYAHEEGPLKDMARRHTADGVVWLAINSGAPGKQGHGVTANKDAARTWTMSHPVLLDEKGEVGQMYGAKTTPQMVVIDPLGVIQYAGALDNAPLGRAQGRTINYVESALEDLAASREVKTSHTKPYGCSVKYP